MAPAWRDGCWHVDMDILVEDLHWQAHLGPPHSIEDVDRPPDLNAVLAFDGVDELGLGDIVIESDRQAHAHGISNEDVG